MGSTYNPPIQVECARCGGLFFIPYWRLARGRKTFYCSEECQYVRHTIPCDFCGDSFTVTDSKFNSEQKNFYCSRDCQSKHRKITGKGELHNQWKGGITPANTKVRNSEEYKDWREEVFERDDFTCQKCESRGGKLNAHHILPFSNFIEERLVVANGATLCKECHTIFHMKYGKVDFDNLNYYEWLGGY